MQDCVSQSAVCMNRTQIKDLEVPCFTRPGL